MSTFEVWLIIILVIGVIASNLAVLKYSAKFKMPQFGKPNLPTKKDAPSTTEQSNSDKHTDKPTADLHSSSEQNKQDK